MNFPTWGATPLFTLSCSINGVLNRLDINELQFQDTTVCMWGVYRPWKSRNRSKDFKEPIGTRKVLGFYVISNKASRKTQVVSAFITLHTGSQSPPAALNRDVKLSSRIQRKCIKLGFVYCQNHHRIVSFYNQNVPTCHCCCLIISSCIISSIEHMRAKFREISCITVHPL